MAVLTVRKAVCGFHMRDEYIAASRDFAAASHDASALKARDVQVINPRIA